MKKNDIYKSENVDLNTSKSNRIKEKEISKYNYKCIFLCPISKLECVNSMDIYDDLVVYGTIMGNVYLCHIDKNNLYPKKPHKLEFKEDDKKSGFSEKNTDKNSTDKKEEDKIMPITLKKYKENIYLNDFNDDDNVDSHYNLTYSNINNANQEIDEKNSISEKCSNKININTVNPKKIIFNDNFDKKNEEEVLYIKELKNSDSDNQEQPNEPFPQITSLISKASENISGIVFANKDNIIISIGDEEIIKMEKISTFNPNIPDSKYFYEISKNHALKSYHLLNCENTICFLTPTNYLILNVNLSNFSSDEIRPEAINYTNRIIKDFENIENIKGTIESVNYVVPFDFDGAKFLYLEYIEKNKRKICVYDTINKSDYFENEIEEDFGHISFMKFINNSKIFLVRKYNKCEIYKMNDDFTLVERWEHIGEEIISVQIYFERTKMSGKFIEESDKNENDVSDNLSFNLEEKEDEKAINLKLKSINQINSSSRDLNKRHFKELSNDKLYKNDIDIYNKNNKIRNYKEEIVDLNIYKKFGSNKKKYTEQNSPKAIYIATLDINGNFNLYKNKSNKVLFNLYDIEGIEQNYKDEQFFYFGFPYLITMNSKYICISTDQGIFVITKYRV